MVNHVKYQGFNYKATKFGRTNSFLSRQSLDKALEQESLDTQSKNNVMNPLKGMSLNEISFKAKSASIFNFDNDDEGQWLDCEIKKEAETQAKELKAAMYKQRDKSQAAVEKANKEGTPEAKAALISLKKEVEQFKVYRTGTKQQTKELRALDRLCESFNPNTVTLNQLSHLNAAISNYLKTHADGLEEVITDELFRKKFDF